VRNNIKLVHIVFVASCLIWVFLGSSFADDKYAKDYQARKIQVLGNSAKMHYQDVGLVFDDSGVVGSEGIPEVISLGDFITVKGKTVQANIISVTEYLRDLPHPAIGRPPLAKKGQVACMIASRENDFPHGEMRDRVWIRVEHCRALK
jgi:hypothetical protein